MRRNWRRVAIAALVLLGFCAGAAALIYATSGPSFMAGALTQLFGRRVEIDGMDIRVGRAFEIELRGVRIFQGPAPDGPTLFEVPRAVGTQAWPRLLAGQLIPGSWQLEAPFLRLEARGTAGGRPQLSLPPIPPLDLEVADATVVIQLPEAPPLRITALDLNTTRSRLRARVSGFAAGHVAFGLTPPASFRFELRGWRGDLALEGELRDLDLAALPGESWPRWSGVASGELRARVASGGFRGALDFDVAEFRVELPEFREPIAPARTRVAGELVFDEAGVTLLPHPVELDDLKVAGDLRITRGARGRVRGTLALEDFRPGRPARERLHPIRFLGLRHQLWADLDRRIEGGWVEDGRIEVDLPLEGLDRSLAYERELAPSELRIAARVRDGIYRPSPEASPLEDVSGAFEVVGNRLEIRHLRMRREGESLPQVDISVEGMHRLAHLPPEERQVPAGPGVPIPGLATAFAALRVQAPDEQPPLEVHFEELQIGYPAFVLPVRDARGVARFPEGNVVIENAEAVVGGVPGRVSVVWDPGANSVWADLAYEDGQAPPPVDAGDPWAAGRFAIDTLYLGDWRMDDVFGRFQATAAEIDVTDVLGSVHGGAAHASGYVSFANESAAPYAFQASVAGGDAAGLHEPLELRDGTLTGRVWMDGRFAGLLSPERDYYDDAEVGLAVRFENGTCDHLPLLVVMARLPSLQGIRGLLGAALPYDAVSADITIKDGLLRTENFALQGPELRMHIRGQMDLLSEQNEVDLLLAMFFLETVDRVIGQVPVVGDWVLGEDQNLVGIYLVLDGPWEDPQARMLTPGSFYAAAGWAGKLIASGAKQFQKFFLRRVPEPPEESDGDGATGVPENP